jgi:glycerol-3-phosphate acyltransferase PlsX
MNIGLDMMGGDFSPLEVVKGILLYLKECPSPAMLWLVGDEQKVRPLLQEHAIPAGSVHVVHASQVIGMNDMDRSRRNSKLLQQRPDFLFISHQP